MRTTAQEEKRSLEVAEAARETEWRKPSFVKELFMGELRTDLVFPFPEQDAVDKARGDEILAQVREYLEKNLDPDRVDRTGNIPKPFIAGLAKLGLFGIKIPKEYGGLDLSQRNYNRIIHLVASHCASTAVFLSAHQSIGVPQPLKMFGTEEQKQAYLPRLAAGAISAFALTEPGVGSDPSRMSTCARLAEDGESWILNGEKLWITNGPIAELLIVMARTNDPQVDKPEISAFIVEGDSHGLDAAHRCDFMGLKGLRNGLLRFTEVRVPAANLLGRRGEGLRLALQTLNVGRLTLPAACAATMKQALAIATDFAANRNQWGAPVGHHEAVAAKIARMSADLFAVDSLAWLTSAMADAADTDIRLEAAMAKLYCTEALWRCVDDAVQVRGGRGYETADSLRGRGEAPVPTERLLRDARINLIIEGTSEIMHLFIAREALDAHLKVAGMSATATRMDVKSAARHYVKWYPLLWLPRTAVFKSVDLPWNLKRHLWFVERATRRLARDLFHRMLVHRQGLQKKQALLARLVDAGAELFAMSAVLARAGSRAAPPGAEKLADLFCRQARRRLGRLHREVYFNDDRQAYSRAREVLGGHYPWLTDNILSTWKNTESRE
ncbi:acyl-CoA dehydrogenase family protein [Geoalkalibacter halelectricus]|uniref:Acyl-CoA dehydrogenase family protein n=1 Tax=Geoalkalibacter halelectricus TaxID=2847045 RepID=A0ABY5ZGM5_9BACT|nr:acyl-CoA dehydrogenase family protein [Geoalkalibacter halelectricus]MDO3378179.1 acyl-CoA dehydrogenase family protein [Geoalkalibacter halelectricus]UWZ78024.1 acyl-CoA dehydrogenase family protein [Geoalkalibacter halelectricus]